MKKVGLSFLIFILMITLLGCTSIVEPLENPESELFTVFYTGSNYEIYKRTEIDEEKIYPLIGFPVKSDKGTSCTIGLYHLENYIVQYKEDYYDLQSGSRLNLFTGNKLIDIGINANCKNE